MSTTSPNRLAKVDKQKNVANDIQFLFRSTFWGLILTVAAACSVHQNGAADQKVAPTLGVSDQEASRGPASVVSPPHFSNPDEKATGQAGARGGGFDRNSASVRDSANPTEGIEAEKRKK